MQAPASLLEIYERVAPAPVSTVIAFAPKWPSGGPFIMQVPTDSSWSWVFDAAQLAAYYAYLANPPFSESRYSHRNSAAAVALQIPSGNPDYYAYLHKDDGAGQGGLFGSIGGVVSSIGASLNSGVTQLATNINQGAAALGTNVAPLVAATGSVGQLVATATDLGLETIAPIAAGHQGVNTVGQAITAFDSSAGVTPTGLDFNSNDSNVYKDAVVPTAQIAGAIVVGVFTAGAGAAPAAAAEAQLDKDLGVQQGDTSLAKAAPAIAAIAGTAIGAYESGGDSNPTAPPPSSADQQAAADKAAAVAAAAKAQGLLDQVRGLLPGLSTGAAPSAPAPVSSSGLGAFASVGLLALALL